MVGDGVEIVIVGIKHGCVSIGVKAPKGVPVLRKEICLKYKK